MEFQKSKIVTIGIIQATVSDDVTANMKKAAEKIRYAAEKGAEIVCLEELYRTKYFPQQDKKDFKSLAETIPGESTMLFSSLAKELDIVIIAPLFERGSDGKYYNSAAVIDADGKLLETYRKIHIPYDRFFYEKSYFEEGNLGYKVYHTKYASFSVLICFDQWFPEAARICTLKGADIIFYPTAIGTIKEYAPFEGGWHGAWEMIQRGHAIANGVHVVAVNRVGGEGELKFWGSSFVCDSFGNVLAKAGKEKDEIIVAEVDLGMNKRVQDAWGFLRNRRPDTYDLICKSNGIQTKIGSFSPNKTPAELGYAMPAEWEKHDAVWLAWPYDPATFDKVEHAEEAYADIIYAIHESERVNLLVTDDEMKSRAAKLLLKKGVNMKKVNMIFHDYADVWFRDYGPVFVANKKEKKLAMVNWIYNAYGAKYEELMKDTDVPDRINRDMNLPCFKPGIVMEGGSIDVNGKGTLITTEQCLLNKNRNKHLNKEEIEKYLKDYLGVRHIIWLKDGVAGDDTDGHVDDIARFVNPATVLCAFEENAKDENHAILNENYEILKKSKDQDGNSLNVIKLPMPGPVMAGKTRLPASYANFYIGNKVVLVPVFGHKNDKVALKIIQKAFPERKAVGINCTDLVYGLGTIHCVTQQEPAIE